MNKDIKEFTDIELYKAQAELLKQAMQLNSNLTIVEQEIKFRESNKDKSDPTA